MSAPEPEPERDAGAEQAADKPDTSFAYRHGDKLIAVGILALLGLVLYFNA